MFDDSRIEDIEISSFQCRGSLQYSNHTLLVNQFRDFLHAQYPEHRFQAEKDTGFRKGKSLGEVAMIESLSSGGWSWNILVAQEGRNTEGFAKGDNLNPDWVDLNKIRHWKAECLDSHGSKCENPMKIWPTRPAWLVDVKSECIVPGTLDAVFVALSYTYGNRIGLNVDIELNARLQEPYAFRVPDIAARLPPILRHAMFLIEALDVRYLWIDSLCIVHGNSAETASMMGSIYANAVLTIVATDGDAEDGIAGLKGASSYRLPEQKIIPFANRKIIVRNTDNFSLAMRQPPYFSRAWTFQEFMMARRKLFFCQKQVDWECQHRQSHEEVARGAEVDTYLEPRLI